MDRLAENLEPGLTLSKFFTFNENSIQAMSEPYLWFSTLEAFNDPFEGAVELSTDFNPEEWNSTANLIRSRHPENSGYALLANAMRAGDVVGGFETRELFIKALATRFKERLSKHGYCCLFKDHELTEKSDILMWGHYGNGLKGFKVIFDSERLIASLPKTTARAPIRYGTSIPRLDILETARRSAEALSGSDRAIAALTASEHLRTKHEAWEYEKEYRFISPQTGAHKFDPASIKEVIFGEKMPISQQKVIRSVISINSPTTLFRTATVSKTSYGLIIE